MRRRTCSKSVYLTTLATVLVICATPAVAQDAPRQRPTDLKTQLRGSGPVLSPDDSNTIRVNVKLVQVPVTVLDPYGRLVTGLDRGHFRVFENKQEQEIAHFSSEDVPISVGIILDVSGSMANKFDYACQAALQFMRTSNPEDEFLLVTFNERAALASSFTKDVETLQSRMLFTPPPKGRTALLDAVYLAMARMRDARHSRKALLIISDGGDNHSRYNERDIQNAVREAEVQIYGVGIYDPWGSRSTPEELRGPALLSDITELTGGRSFTVQNINDLPDIASKISLELRNQYMIAYRPATRSNDGAWRKIKVKLNTPRGLPALQAYARTGYYASRQ